MNEEIGENKAMKFTKTLGAIKHIMKVVFNNGVETPITDVSSVYSLGIPTVDEAEVEAFKALLTQENLKHFQIVDDNGAVVAEANNFVFQGISGSDPIGEERTETNFMLRVMTDTEIELSILKEEKELQAEAITELAGIVAEM